MDSIFHEKQEGSLCAQHCLNALLQGSYFTAVDLGTLAQSLDDEERIRMAESGLESEEYQRFIAQPSGNMDDSGYFSVQVIGKALQVWGLDILPYNSQEEVAVVAQQCPSLVCIRVAHNLEQRIWRLGAMIAFICNYRDHWFTIRKLGNQWFNLNSLLAKPQLISDTYLAMFLAQLQQEGYSIFIVRGELPDCPADRILTATPYVPPVRESSNTTRGRATSAGSEDEDLQAALALSLAEQQTNPGTSKNQTVKVKEDDELKVALALSLNEERNIDETVSSNKLSSDEEKELEAALKLSLTVGEHNCGGINKAIKLSSDNNDKEEEEEDDFTKAIRLSLESQQHLQNNKGDDEELDKALKLSLECAETVSPARPANPEEVRRKRLAYLEAASKKS